VAFWRICAIRDGNGMTPSTLPLCTFFESRFGFGAGKRDAVSNPSGKPMMRSNGAILRAVLQIDKTKEESAPAEFRS
jgi:hypothetical protein